MLKVNPKEVNPGDTFLVLENEDQEIKVEEAIDRGAACIIATNGDYSVKTIITNDTRTYLSNYLKELYFEKLDKIKIIGIVGTSGKTVTGDVTYQLLNSLGSKTAFIGTGGFYIDNQIIETNVTTPDIYNLYEYINKAIDKGCENIIIEVSSKALIKRHIEGLRFDIAVFTNFIDNSDAIEKQKYLNTKIEMFKMLKKTGTAIINKKDPYYKYFALPQNHNIFYGTDDSEYKISSIGLTYEFTEFNLNDKRVEIPLLGSFNIYNYLAAFATANTLNYPEDAIIQATENLKQVDGRYQGVKHKNSLVIIDYAYDKEMIESVIKYTKEFSKARIITLMGLKGGQNQNQRSKIGKLITKNSDYVILTSDNPKNENAEDIINEMIKEVVTDNYEIIISRREAIKKGIEILEEGDILLVIGKGNENYQIIDNDKLPYKDYNEVTKYVKK
ncbi:MAG: UDP-N-acetylmuramyl-tripeptide synthetase [Bacilli bacterium]|nr:UDP-N-acetylmuramyl-tripeptide synthetase [Bacilli bacterium]